MAAPRKDNVSKLILDAAEQLLDTKALSEFSLSELARTAGISKGTLYYHYKNKEDILFALMDRYLEQQWQDLLDWTGDASKDTSLPRLVKYVLERDISTADMRFHFFYAATAGNELLRQKLLKRYHDFAVLISEKIRERSKAVSPDYLAWLILMLSDGLLMQKMLGNTDMPADAFIRETELNLKRLLSDSP